MSPNPSLLAASCLPALPFTPEDFAASDILQHLFVDRGISVSTTPNYPGLPHAVEISWPNDASDPRWLIWQNAAGVWLDEFDSHERNGPLMSIAEALKMAWRIMERETEKALATSTVR